MLIQARVMAVDPVAEDIRVYDVATADDSMLPAYEAGAHIDVHLPSGKIRQYSLCGDERDRTRYQFAIQKATEGRGGSEEAFRALLPGARLQISAPRNNFRVASHATQHLFIAGGIGITPIVSMVRSVARDSMAFRLVYCTRSLARTAFREYCSALASEGKAQLHHDEGRPDAQYDFDALLAMQPEGAHIYCCGPEGMMAAVRAAAARWKPGTVHFEHFTNALLDSSTTGQDGPFAVQLLRSGKTVEVPPDRTIIEVLRERGVEVETSCESGLCGTCKTRYVSGTPEHRDLVLDDDEHREYMMICCSRSKSDLLVLDL